VSAEPGGAPRAGGPAAEELPRLRGAERAAFVGDLATTERILVAFLANEVGKAGFSRAVVGLSGGVDSSLSATLAVRAFGAENVLGVVMPYRTSSPDSARDAVEVAAALGIATRTVEITRQVDAYFETFPDASPLRRGNKMARERMSVLYDQSAASGALVVGTSNKTELLLGYGTQHGDMASAVNPIGDLYKTQVRRLAAHVGVPARILAKVPSADLWEGQSDEGDLGFTYAEVDQLLFLLVDARMTRAEILERAFAAPFVDRVEGLIRRSQFKRRLPTIAKISGRTVASDFLYARDWGS
jgi:NAD+ synthase